MEPGRENEGPKKPPPCKNVSGLDFDGLDYPLTKERMQDEDVLGQHRAPNPEGIQY